MIWTLSLCTEQWKVSQHPGQIGILVQNRTEMPEWLPEVTTAQVGTVQGCGMMGTAPASSTSIVKPKVRIYFNV